MTNSAEPVSEIDGGGGAAHGSGQQAAAPANASMQELLELIGQSYDGVYAVDAEQRIVYWSGRAEEILGHRGADVVGRFCYEVMQGDGYDGRPFCRQDCPTIAEVRRGRGVPCYDIGTRTEGGDDIWLNQSIVPVSDEVSGQSLAVHLFRDVTDRRRAERLAQETVSAVRSFLERNGEEPADVDQPYPVPTPKLTGRELGVLHCLARGEGTAKIADTLDISSGTARNHLSSMMRKLGVHSRLEAVVRASQLGLL